MAKKVAFRSKPSTRATVTADEWVAGSGAPMEEKKTELTRYTIDIPVELHARIKSYCALKHVKMRDEIIELLKQHFRGKP
jgi:hypothetical protein